jgi:hypothetical protein
MFRKYRDFEPGEFVLIFADTAWGGGDFCAAQFMSHNRLDVPLVFHKKCMASDMTPELHNKAQEIAKITGVKPVICYERNNGGIAEIERIVRLNRTNEYTVYQQKRGLGDRGNMQITEKYGWDTTSATRPMMLAGLKEAVDNKLIRIYDKPTITEMYSFIEKQTATGWKPIAEAGAHDDLVMSLAGVYQMYQSEKPPVKNNRVKRKKNYDATTGRVLS